MTTQDIVFEQDAVFLVTGGAGFIGSNLCEALLNKGHKVRCLDNLSNGKFDNIAEFMKQPNFEFIEGDITDYDTCLSACTGVRYVTHQAAWGSVPRSILMPQHYEETNIKGTLNMLEAARQCQVEKFVYASSSSVYGDHPALPKCEGVEGKVLSPYALTKKVCEEYARLYTSLYGLDTYGLRYFNVFGRRQNPEGSYAAVIPKYIKLLQENQAPVIHGDGRQSRDFTYIDNVIEANLRSFKASKEAAGEVYNIAFGGNVSLMNLYRTLADLLDKPIDPTYGPERAGDVKHSKADISKARQLIGYDPAYDFYSGIALAVDWYKANL